MAVHAGAELTDHVERFLGEIEAGGRRISTSTSPGIGLRDGIDMKATLFLMRETQPRGDQLATNVKGRECATFLAITKAAGRIDDYKSFGFLGAHIDHSSTIAPAKIDRTQVVKKCSGNVRGNKHRISICNAKAIITRCFSKAVEQRAGGAQVHAKASRELCSCVFPLAPALRSTDSAALAPADASAVGFLRFVRRLHCYAQVHAKASREIGWATPRSGPGGSSRVVSSAKRSRGQPLCQKITCRIDSADHDSANSSNLASSIRRSVPGRTRTVCVVVVQLPVTQGARVHRAGLREQIQIGPMRDGRRRQSDRAGDLRHARHAHAAPGAPSQGGRPRLLQPQPRYLAGILRPRSSPRAPTRTGSTRSRMCATPASTSAAAASSAWARAPRIASA
jgi:hypothetical protein